MPRAKKTESVQEQTTTPVENSVNLEFIKAIAEALKTSTVEAIKATKPIEKKTAVTRVPRTPWTPKDGSPKLKLKRKMYQHGLLIDPDMETNETIDLLNKLRPGTFMDGWVKVVRRKDKGIDIDYAIKTASQRLKLVNQFGIRNFNELLQRCIDEAANPKQFKTEDDE